MECQCLRKKLFCVGNSSYFALRYRLRRVFHGPAKMLEKQPRGQRFLSPWDRCANPFEWSLVSLRPARLGRSSSAWFAFSVSGSDARDFGEMIVALTGY